jgi:hypothetical protein
MNKPDFSDRIDKEIPEELRALGFYVDPIAFDHLVLMEEEFSIEVIRVSQEDELWIVRTEELPDFWDMPGVTYEIFESLERLCEYAEGYKRG